MKHVLPVLLILVAFGFAVYLSATMRKGETMREQERLAAAAVQTIMQHEVSWWERRRQDGENPEYALLSELIAAGLLDGFEVLQLDEKQELLAKDGYLFQLRLRQSHEDTEQGPELRQRYELWAWPQVEANTAMVLFFGSNAGYLIQGENGETSGRYGRPPDKSPLREMEETRLAANRRTGRWLVLEEIR